MTTDGAQDVFKRFAVVELSDMRMDNAALGSPWTPKRMILWTFSANDSFTGASLSEPVKDSELVQVIYELVVSITV
jgi:hypothetical protein